MLKNKNKIFNNFMEYYNLTKNLDQHQKYLLYSSLPKSEVKNISNSFYKGGWNDLLMENEIDKIIDEINIKYSIDLYNIRISVLFGNQIKINKLFWEQMIIIFNQYDKKYIHKIFGGITVLDFDNDNYILISNRKK